jgi:hypothetical protein
MKEQLELHNRLLLEEVPMSMKTNREEACRTPWQIPLPGILAGLPRNPLFGKIGA